MPVTFQDWDPVIHCAPTAAYDLLKKFYAITTGREIKDELQPIQEQYIRDAQDPEYAKPTIAQKMKEKELVRIADEKVQQYMAKTIITAHNEMLRTDRVTNPERFTFVRSQPIEEESFVKSRKPGFGASQTGGNSQADLPNADVKQVSVKTANKQIRGLRQGKKDGKGGFAVADDDNDEITFEYVLADIVGSTLANKMGKNDPEYKNLKESFDNVVQYFMDRINYIADELILDVFVEINARADELVTVVSKNMMDFCDLFQFFSHVLKFVNPQVSSTGTTDSDVAEEQNIFKVIIDVFTSLGNKILNEDPQQTELYFLEYGIDGLLEIMCENDFKRTQLSMVLYCFCRNGAVAHLRVLNRVKDKVASTHKDAYISIVNDLLEYDEIQEKEGYLWGNADMYDFYFEVAKRGLYFTSPVTRTKALSILSQLAPCSLVPMFQLLPSIRKMVDSQQWELQGQLLILSNCALQELVNDKTKLQDETEEIDQSQLRAIDHMYDKQQGEDMIPQFLDIVNKIFTVDSPKATQKIGLTYLASIIKCFPDLCDRYLEILLNVSQEIRSDILYIPESEHDEKLNTK